MNFFLKNIKKNLNIIENMDVFQDNKKSDFLRKYSTKCERLEINISNKFHLDIMKH